MKILAMVSACLVLVSCGGPSPPQHAEKENQLRPISRMGANTKPERKEAVTSWEKVATFGAITTVYMPPKALADKFLIAQVLHTLRSGARIQQVWFFDKRSENPTGVPMTDSQILHWRVRYAVNKNTGYEEFIYLTVVNAHSSPPELRQTKANIRPGYAE